MLDPFSWSFPIGRWFGIAIRIHVLFPLVAVAMVIRTMVDNPTIPGVWKDAMLIVCVLFFSVLLHEFGHCFGGRSVGGEATEVLLWPLGGLARVDVPHTPWANFVTTACGPLVNLLLCLVSALALAFCFEVSFAPPWNPFAWSPLRADGRLLMNTWSGTEFWTSHWGVIAMAWFFYLNWFLFLFNVLVVAYPMDGGRLLQEALWPRVGYHKATYIAVFVGFIYMFLLIVVAIVFKEVLLLFLAFFIYTSCKAEWLALESGAEESLFGYDFSQGYTSLERDEAPPRPAKKKPNFIQRWWQNRAAKKQQKTQERQQAEERRMDELLDKIQRYGKQSLSEEEHRFLLKVSDRYKKK